jgi:predicted Zn-dependent protease
MGRSSKAKQRLASQPKAGAAPPRTRRWQWVVFVAGLLALGAGGWYFWREWQAMSEARRGIELVRVQRYADALPILRKAYERSPRDISVVANLVQALIASGSLATGVEPILSRWCELEPDNPEPFKLRLDAWNKVGDRGRALADGLRVLELEPENDAVRKNVAWLLILAERFDEAERECLRCLEKDPDNAALLLLYAQVPYQRGVRARAAERLDALLARHPTFAPALALRGTLYNDANPPEYSKAIPLLRQAAAESPDLQVQQSARYQLSRALRGAGRADEADQVLAELRRIQEADRLSADSLQQPDNLAMQVRAAQALLEAGRTDEGLRLLDRVLRRDADFAAAHRVLAAYYEKHGRP